MSEEKEIEEVKLKRITIKTETGSKWFDEPEKLLAWVQQQRQLYAFHAQQSQRYQMHQLFLNRPAFSRHLIGVKLIVLRRRYESTIYR